MQSSPNKNNNNNITQTNTTNTNTSTSSKYYSCDPIALEKLRNDAPWNSNPKYFTNVSISPSAIVKMMTHCHSGVEKGIQKGGNPTEVMGVLLGRPDITTPHTLIITDSFPLPIEGFETSVVADDDTVTNHMILLNESVLEHSRPHEKIMGWYHSHPFDVTYYSHCFLSDTDVTTQLRWQSWEDKNGNPFLAIVVDPLRSVPSMNTLANSGSSSSEGMNIVQPEIKAFRCYPPDYSTLDKYECPDGSIIREEKVRLELWGNCFNRYYELKVDYYMSDSARNVMDLLTKKTIWMRSLTTSHCTAAGGGKKPCHLDCICASIKNMKRLDLRNISSNVSKASAPGSSSGSGTTGGMNNGKISFLSSSSLCSPVTSSSSGTTSTAGGNTSNTIDSETTSNKKPSATSSSTSSNTNTSNTAQNEDGQVWKACESVVDLAMDKIHDNLSQSVKKYIFS